MENHTSVKELIANIESNIKTNEPVFEELPKKSPKVYNKEYYEKNKQILKENAAQKVSCVLCDSIITKSAYNTHRKSKLCLNLYELKLKVKQLNA